MLTPETLLQNRYRIVRPIGKGGMGTVYMAKDERLRSVVALKESFFSDERLRRAFEREAELLANLHHPALPNVIDHFTEGDGQFLVMQFISGEDLGEMEVKGHLFSTEEVLRWGDQLLDALDYLHTQEPPILHRDIKPQNLKLTGRGQIILLDFGLAKGTAGQMSSIAASRSVLGFTPNFAPLEQIQGEGTDARSDLYSLAATIYFLMTGVQPPDALARASAIVRGQRDPLRPADELNPAIPTTVARVLQKAMAQNPEERVQTAAAMRDALLDAIQQARAPIVEATLPPTEIVGHENETAPERQLQPELKTVASPHIETTPETVTKEVVPPTIASPVQRDSVSDEHKPSEFGKAPFDNFPDNSISFSKLGLAPVVGASSRQRKGRLWLGVGVAVTLVVIGLLIAASAGLFKRTAASKTGNVKASNTSNAGVDATPVAKSTPPATKAVNEPRAGTPLRNQIGMEFVYVPAGTFMMGSDRSDDGKPTPQDEKPVHQVTFQSGFYMGKYEVTQAQWRRVTGLTIRQQRNLDDPASQMYGEGDNRPIYYASWSDVQEFIKRLNALNDGYQYRLPSEAEWEYACRAGTTGDYAGDLNAMAWYGWPEHKTGFGVHPVGQKQPNAWGIYDMYGNLWEWCEDPWHDNYNGAPTDGSAWLSGGDSTKRVLRGGGWSYDSDSDLRSANRYSQSVEGRNFYYGIRIVAVTRPS